MKTNKNIKMKTTRCHSLTNDSEKIRNLNQMPYLTNTQGMTNETGRSMVEMLGVLAVIGVLSIAGIAGYNMAINKHQANEILNGASQRAMVVSSQLQADSSATPDLGEFSSENSVGGATFGAAEKVGTAQFKIKFTDAPATEVCTEMKNTAGDGSTGNVKIESACSYLIYNNDLSNGVTLDKNSNYDSENEKCKPQYYGSFCENACPSGTGTDTGTYKGNQVGTTGCYCENSGEKWDGTECKSQKVFYASEYVESVNDLLNMDESERCPGGGHLASMEELGDLGCIEELDTVCSNWPNGLYGTTATLVDDESVYSIDPEGNVLSTYLDDDYAGDNPLCVKD